MITLSNGHSFEHMAASGALAFDGKGWPWEQPLRWAGLLDPSLFTVVIKTLTRHPRKGNLRWYNPLRCVRFMRTGAVNAVGLTNPGIEWWCEKIGPTINKNDIAMMGSILSDANTDELAEMTEMLNAFDLVGLEVNASCPNTQGEMLGNVETVIEGLTKVKAKTRFPLVVKLSVMHDIEHLVKRLEGLVEAISINTVPWAKMFPDTKSPLSKFGGGGVSGKIAQPYTWDMVQRLVALTSLPVIGPGVWDYNDIASLRMLGASAISFGSLFMRYPWRPTLYARRDTNEILPHAKEKTGNT
ncbi:hypothetical protein HYV71_02675 [Candidatus Uhrbacteria bacterium]|nr:hypothetical protein [Candidatus Uhrbacteria bacterium]